MARVLPSASAAVAAAAAAAALPVTQQMTEMSISCQEDIPEKTEPGECECVRCLRLGKPLPPGELFGLFQVFV